MGVKKLALEGAMRCIALQQTGIHAGNAGNVWLTATGSATTNGISMIGRDSAASRNWMKNFWRVLPGATIRPCVRWQEKPCTAIPGEAVGPIGDD